MYLAARQTEGQPFGNLISAKIVSGTGLFKDRDPLGVFGADLSAHNTIVIVKQCHTPLSTTTCPCEPISTAGRLGCGRATAHSFCGWEYGPDLGMPHTRAMGGGLYEIRAKAAEGIGRALYCTLVGQRILILHALVKKTDKTPSHDLALARHRIKEVMKHEQERRP